VLVSSQTASSAELFAAVLQQRGQATLVGQRTRGKTTVQEPCPWDARTTLYVTVGQCHLAQGPSLEGGLMPDEVLLPREDAFTYVVQKWQQQLGKERKQTYDSQSNW